MHYITPDLCDAYPELVQVVEPMFSNFGGRDSFGGEIVTIKCFEDNSLVKAAVDSPGQGRVLVVDGGGSLRTALLGGNLGSAAVRNGWAGVVIDGAVRDVAELALCEVGIRALALMPVPPAKRNAGLADVAVQVQGVWVRPGDWIYADADGTLVAPRAMT